MPSITRWLPGGEAADCQGGEGVDLKLVKATIEQKPILANLLELCAYEFTEFASFDIGDDGFYGYEHLSLYWSDENRYPYLVYINSKIAGFVLVRRCLFAADKTQNVWDVSEFFIMKKYQRQGIGTKVARQIWNQFKGRWQVRVLTNNKAALAFWPKAIVQFTKTEPPIGKVHGPKQEWHAYQFLSQ